MVFKVSMSFDGVSMEFRWPFLVKIWKFNTNCRKYIKTHNFGNFMDPPPYLRYYPTHVLYVFSHRGPSNLWSTQRRAIAPTRPNLRSVARTRYVECASSNPVGRHLTCDPTHRTLGCQSCNKTCWKFKLCWQRSRARPDALNPWMPELQWDLLKVQTLLADI